MSEKKKTYTFSEDDTKGILLVIAQLEVLLKEATFKEMEYSTIGALMKLEQDKHILKQKIQSKLKEDVTPFAQSPVKKAEKKKKKGKKK